MKRQGLHTRTQVRGRFAQHNVGVTPIANRLRGLRNPRKLLGEANSRHKALKKYPSHREATGVYFTHQGARRLRLLGRVIGSRCIVHYLSRCIVVFRLTLAIRLGNHATLLGFDLLFGLARIVESQT